MGIVKRVASALGLAGSAVGLVLMWVLFILLDIVITAGFIYAVLWVLENIFHVAIPWI